MNPTKEEWAYLTDSVKDYEEALAKPYSAFRRLGFATRVVLQLEHWALRLPVVGLEGLLLEAEWERQTALAIMAGDPLPPRPDIPRFRPATPTTSAGLSEPPARHPAGAPPEPSDL